MIIDKKETTVGYRCPECGSAVLSMVGIFALSADMIKLKCECGGSELTIKYERGASAGERKVRLTVPCLFCPEPHIHTLSSAVFFTRDLFCLPCGYYGIDILFLGSPTKVTEAMAEVQDRLCELVGDDDDDPDTVHSFVPDDGEVAAKLSAMRGGKNQLPMTDPQVLDIIEYVVRDIAECGGIRCACADGETDPDRYTVEITEESAVVRCEKCGATAEIGIGSVDAAMQFLHADEIVLEKR